MIGIQAMAVIANQTGNTADAANYSSIAHSYITQWQTLGIDYNTTTPHAELNYGNTSSYVLLYNLFGDARVTNRRIWVTWPSEEEDEEKLPVLNLRRRSAVVMADAN